MGICLERSPELVVGLLGILKAGGAYVPLDPAVPARSGWPSCSRTRGRRAADPASSCAAALPGAGAASAAASTLEPDATADRRRPRRRRGLPPATSPTSSTPPARPASPRAWCSTHRSLVNLVGLVHRQLQRRTPATGVLPLTSFGFDSFVGEIFPPLCAGGAAGAAGPRASMLDAGAAGRADRARTACRSSATVPSMLADPRTRRRSELPPAAADPGRRRGAAGRATSTALLGSRPTDRQRLRPDRDHRLLDLLPRSAGGPAAAAARVPDRPAARQPPASTCSTASCSRCRSACAGRAVHRRRRRWPAATCGGPELTAERFVPDPFGDAGRAPVPHRRPGALAAGRRASSSSAASTTRSRSAASASSWARSRPRCAATRRCARRWWCAREDARRASGWWPTWCRRGDGGGPGGRRAARLPARERCRTTWCRRPSSSCRRCR